MAGMSDQEKRAVEIANRQRNFQNLLSKGQFEATNPFVGYQNPFNYEDIKQNLDTAFNQSANILNRTTADAIAEAKSQATSSLASRGITGGSAITNSLSGIDTKLNKQRVNILGNLSANRERTLANTMNNLNRLGLSRTQGQANVALANQRNTLSGLLGSARNELGAAGYIDNTTWLDDVLEGLKVAADVASTILQVPGVLPG